MGEGKRKGNVCRIDCQEALVFISVYKMSS